MRKRGTLIISILIINLLVFTHNSIAQKLYFNAGIGYGMGMQADYYHLHDATFIYSEDSTTSYAMLSTEKFSMGQGLQVEVGLGTYTGKHLSLELTGFYHKGSPQSITNRSRSYYYDSYELELIEKETFNSSMYGFKPSLVLWGKDGKFCPYLKAGVILGFASISVDEEITLHNSNPYYYPTESIIAVFEYQTRLSYGVNAAAGMQVSFGDDFRLFAECSYAGISYVPIKGEYLEYKYDSEEFVEDMLQSERYYEYVDEYDSRENKNENEPTKELKTAYSFSKLAFLIGIRIDLIN